MKVEIQNYQKTLSFSFDNIKKIIRLILCKEKIDTDLISVVFLSKKEICRLHKHFFMDPSPTDCISVPIDSPFEKGIKPKILGEIYICPAIAKEYVKKNRQSPYPETMRYLIHGLLHLIGYDDKNGKNREIMQKKEREYMVLIKEANLEIQKR